MDSKQVLMLIARQWNEIGEQEKEAWQLKAEQLRQVNAAAATDAAAMLEEEAIEEEPPLDDDWNDKKRASRKAPPPEAEITAHV